MRFLLFMVLVVLLVSPAQAADSHFATPEGIAPLLDHSDPTKAKTMNDYADLYYKNCRTLNKSETMAGYMDAQCACTAAKLPAILTLEQAQALFSGKPSAYLQGRVLMLAYAPCMTESVRNIAYDTCFDTQTRIKHRKNVCTCVADGVAGYIDKYGYRMIPGMMNSEFDPKKAVDNPLAYVLDLEGFKGKTTYYTNSCVQRKEFGW
ncbi:MAG: hypothetical protein IT558_05225 [Alphaproteobacteria bacterium]|nr:hypothetical protein [Alphaproteobacteria bacterium]